MNDIDEIQNRLAFSVVWIISGPRSISDETIRLFGGNPAAFRNDETGNERAKFLKREMSIFLIDFLMKNINPDHPD